MLRRAIEIIGRGFSDVWDNLFVLVAVNSLWALSLLPAFGLLTGLTGLLGLLLAVVALVLITCPITLSIYHITIEVTRLERIEFSEFVRGLRLYYKRAWLVGGINAAFGLIFYFNFVFYLSSADLGSPLALLALVWVAVAFIWFTLSLYMWPLAIRMDDFSWQGMLRNSLLAAFKYPALTLPISLAMLIFLYLCSWFLPTLFLFGICYYALVGNKALSAVLQRERAQTTPNQALVESLPTPRANWPEDPNFNKTDRRRR